MPPLLSFHSWVVWHTAVAVALLLALLSLQRVRRSLQQTTLTGPWRWSVASVLLIGCAEFLALNVVSAGWLSPVRYLVAVSSLCPVVALLGAQRPQVREWEFIVFAFWVLLAMPAASALLFPRGPFAVYGLWSWLLLGLVILSFLNFCATRFWLSGLIVSAAQAGLLLEYLPFGQSIFRVAVGSPDIPYTARAVLALALIPVAVVVGVAVGHFTRGRKTWFEYDRVWLDFRDSFGVLWALRISERVNTVAKTNGWPIALNWKGFRRPADEGQPLLPEFEQSPTADAVQPQLSSEALRTLDQVIHNLLRRFVSRDWIDDRIGR